MPEGQPADDGGASPDEPDDREFCLIGDDDLGAADLGPAAPEFHGSRRPFGWDKGNNPVERPRHQKTAGITTIV
jgi:hypothetical protein